MHAPRDIIVRAITKLPMQPTIGEFLQHITLQGGVGIMLALLYFIVLTKNKSKYKLVNSFQLIPFVICFLAHTVNNTIVILFEYY